MEAYLSVNKCHHPFPSPSLMLESSLPAAAVVGIFQEVTLACINQIQNTQKSFLLTCWLDVKCYCIHFLSEWSHLVKRRYTEDSSNLMYCIRKASAGHLKKTPTFKKYRLYLQIMHKLKSWRFGSLFFFNQKFNAEFKKSCISIKF